MPEWMIPFLVEERERDEAAMLDRLGDRQRERYERMLREDSYDDGNAD